MRGNIISYYDMIARERTSLQRGMNFRLHGRHSVILMSVQHNAPYKDRIEDDGETLIYEGHDVPRNIHPIPKTVDQQKFTPKGSLTNNGKFYDAAEAYKNGQKGPDIVRVYEKVKKGIWVDNGYFHLVDAWLENDDTRQVFKFKLTAIESDDLDAPAQDEKPSDKKHSRIIPTIVKLEVWKRDGGKCVTCGAKDELHFDHILPYSKGGTSLKADNIQLLCARHNLQKSDTIV